MSKILFNNRIARLIWCVVICVALYFVGSIPSLQFDDFQTFWVFLIVVCLAMQILWDVLDFGFLDVKIFKSLKMILFYVVCAADFLFVFLSVGGAMPEGFEALPMISRVFIGGCVLASPVACVVYTIVTTSEYYEHGIEPFVPLIVFGVAMVLGLLSAVIGGISAGLSKAAPIIFVVVALVAIVVISWRRGLPFLAVGGKKSKKSSHTHDGASANTHTDYATDAHVVAASDTADKRRCCGSDVMRTAMEQKMSGNGYDHGTVVGADGVKLNYNVIFKGGYIDNSVEVKIVLDVESDVECTSAVTPREAKTSVVKAVLKDFEQTTDALHRDLRDIAAETVEQLRDDYKGLDDVQKVVVELNVRKPDLSHITLLDD